MRVAEFRLQNVKTYSVHVISNALILNFEMLFFLSSLFENVRKMFKPRSRQLHIHLNLHRSSHGGQTKWQLYMEDGRTFANGKNKQKLVYLKVNLFIYRLLLL